MWQGKDVSKLQYCGIPIHSNSSSTPIPYTHIHNTDVKIYEWKIPFEAEDGKESALTRTHSHGIRHRGIYDEKLLFNIFNLFYSTVLFFPPPSLTRIKYNSFQTIAY